jgi:hypothetical protein
MLTQRMETQANVWLLPLHTSEAEAGDASGMWLVALGPPFAFTPVRTSDRKGEPVVTVIHMISRALECVYSVRYSNTTRSKQ